VITISVTTHYKSVSAKGQNGAQHPRSSAVTAGASAISEVNRAGLQPSSNCLPATQASGQRLSQPSPPNLDWTDPRSLESWNGALLTDESGAIWVVYGAAKFRVPDEATYRRFFAGWTPSRAPDDLLEGLRGEPCDGTLLRDDSGTIWAIFGGAKFPVPDLPTYNRLFGQRAYHRIWSSALADLPAVPRDGTLLREESSPELYVILGGTKHRVVAHREPAHVLWAGALAQIPRA
jgi:hypothetical protein